MSKTSTLLIRTPEGIVFSQLLAGPMSRFLAWLIDFCIVLCATIAVGTLLTLLDLVAEGFAQAIGVLLQFALMLGYGIYFEWFKRGQTIGMTGDTGNAGDTPHLHWQLCRAPCPTGDRRARTQGPHGEGAAEEVAALRRERAECVHLDAARAATTRK